MYSTPLAQALAALPVLSSAECAALLTDASLTTLLEVFARVPDPRGQRGRRYSLPFLLTCLVAALLCACDSTVAVEQWCQEHQAHLGAVFGPVRYRTPSGSLYRRLLPRLSVEHLEWALAGWVQTTRTHGSRARSGATADQVPDQEALAIDGKRLCGAQVAAAGSAGTTTESAPHLLTLYTHTTQEVLLQVRVSDKTNEIPIAQAVVPHVLAHSAPGRVVTADALHTQTAFVQAVRAAGGHVVLTVKGNQPTLYTDLADLFADPLTTVQVAQSVDYQRGRREERTLEVTTELTAFLASASPWREIAQVGRLTRLVHIRAQAKTTREVVYLITTLPPEQADPEALLTYVRHHWHIENGLHYVRDVTFGEDRSRLRTGHAPQFVASLRNLVLTLIRRTGTTAITAARRAFSYHPERAFALLGLAPLP